MTSGQENSTQTTAGRRTGPTRHFLSLEQSILPAVVEHFFQAFVQGNTCDMREQLVVLPSSLAQRRLTELLALKAEAEAVILYPPKIVTIGTLPERLYVAKLPFASDLVQELAWVDALKSVPPQELKKIVPVPPPPAASQQWLELGKMLSGIHRETSSERLNFNSVAEALALHPEAQRWRALAAVQTAYLSKLDQMQLWDVQTARLFALEHDEPQLTGQRRIIVVACVDLNATQRGFLQAVSSQVDIYIGAPESDHQRFDAYGCLVSSQWQDVEVDLPSDCLLVGGGPQDQADLVAGSLAELGDKYHVRDVTLGVPDSSLVGDLRRELALCNITARYGPGVSLTQSEPAQLLGLIASYVTLGRYEDFAALVRQPAVDNLVRLKKLDVPKNWLSQLDRYSTAVLPKSIGEFVNEAAKEAPTFVAIKQLLDRWLVKLSTRKQPISKWVDPLLGVLTSAYKIENCDLQDPVQGPLYAAALQISEAINALRDIPAELEPSLALAELVDWLLRGCAGKLVPEPSDTSAIEMLGWLELTLDDAPALILTGMHDGVVPESVNSDSFLPNGLRRQLGMMDNARRYARDIYSLQVHIQTRESLRIVSGRTDADGDPLVPSRLLTACPLKDLPARVLHLVSEDSFDVLPAVRRRWQATDGGSTLAIPQPQPARPLAKVSVTAFRDYLACPYRFYLRHVLRLRDEDDSTRELDAAGFGNLVHETLDGLGDPDMCGCADAELIEKFLLERVQQRATELYGSSPPPAVLIQIEQAEMRLAAFAAKQAQRAAEGWVIRYVEASIEPKHDVLLGEPDAQLRLIGRIDRIDFNQETNQWAIWDYKTSESPKNPVSVHYSKKHGWLDLQLPLYRHLAKKLGVTGEPSLGYISIPKQAVDTGFFPAKFTAAQLAEADSKAHEIASAVVRGEFWPRTGPAEVKYDDYARICQTDIQRVEIAAPITQPGRFQLPESGPVAVDVTNESHQLLSNPVVSHCRLPPVMIRASAGTGKTFQLSNRLLEIILSGQEVDSILATTFTRKAAGEIMHRVLGRLAHACLEPARCGELQEFCGGQSITAAACLAALRRVTASIHRFRISTLDSFFAQIARTFSLEMGLPPGWSTMDPVQEPQVQMEAIARMLDGHDRQTLSELVRMLAKGESSRKVVEQILSTVGAGFDVYRSTTQAAWDQLPLPTPPSEAAVESALLTILNTQIGNKSADGSRTKFHLLASIGDWEGVLAHGIYKNINADPPTYYRKELPSDLVYALNVISDRAAAELLPLRRRQTIASQKVLEAYDSQYSALTRGNRQLAFSDVTHYLAGWLRDNAAPEQSAGVQTMELRLDCGVQHLLLDEFQDTAPQQWQILEPLAKPLGTGPQNQAEDGSFFCVGDTKQAIYGWRGGVAEIFDSVSRSVEGISQGVLSKSFRSSPQVIESVNEVFMNLSQHSNYSGCDSVAKLWSKQFPPHETTRSDLDGYVSLQNTPKTSFDMGTEEKKELILSYAANQVAELASKSDASIGILFRTNADVGRMIAMLRARGVAASQDGGNPLVDSAAVQLVLSLVHLADHPGDSTCAFHIQSSPLAQGLPYDAMKEPQRLASWFRRNVLRTSLASVIARLADELSSHLSWWDQHRLKQLISSAEAFDSKSAGRLHDFEASVERQRVALPSSAQVKVMTVHKSKGLEFDAVFLPDLSISLTPGTSLFVLRGVDPLKPADGVLRYMNAALQEKLPKDWQQAFEQNKQRGVTETLCLLYVAMTRARRALYMFTRPTKSDPSAECGSLLQSTLAANPELVPNPEAELYAIGNPNWYAALPKTLEPAEKSDYQETTIELATAQDSAPARALRVSGPSQIGRYNEPIPLANAFSFDRSLGSTYGNLIHAFFEQVRWREDYQPDVTQLRRIALATVPPDELRHVPLEQSMGEFLEMLELPSVNQALSKSRYQPLLSRGETVEIDNERAISLIVDSELVTGTIDRLAVMYRDGKPYAAEIFDFKTDSYDSKLELLWLEDRLESHRPQMQLYADVVAQLFGIPREQVSAYLIMLKTDDLARCDRAPQPAPS